MVSPAAGDRLLPSRTSAHISISCCDCTIHAIIPPSFTLSLEKLHYREKQPGPSAMTGTSSMLADDWTNRERANERNKSALNLNLTVKAVLSSFVCPAVICRWVLMEGPMDGSDDLINDPPINSTNETFDRTETEAQCWPLAAQVHYNTRAEPSAFSCINMTQTTGQVFTQVEPVCADETDVK